MQVPPPGRDEAATSPPWARASWRTIYRPRPMPPNRRRSPVSPWTNRSKIRSWSPGAMPMPSSSTVTSIQPPDIRAVTVTAPPPGEYLKAFSSSCPTMISVAMGSPWAGGSPSGTTADSVCASDSGRNATAVPRSRAARSNGPLVTVS